jgi:hypothetical protein
LQSKVSLNQHPILLFIFVDALPALRTRTLSRNYYKIICNKSLISKVFLEKCTDNLQLR